MKCTDQLDRFIADLTTTDQLSLRERDRAAADHRRSAARSLRRDVYEARMLAVASYHHAYAASLRACCARVSGWEDAGILSTEEALAVDEMIRATERYMRLALRNKDDERERRAHLKRAGSAATTIVTAPKWKAARARCIALLDAPR